MLQYCMQLLFSTFRALVHIWRVMLEMHAEIHVWIHIMVPLLFSEVNHNWNLEREFSKPPKYEISLKYVLQFSS
jgi:hypothetical protein